MLDPAGPIVHRSYKFRHLESAAMPLVNQTPSRVGRAMRMAALVASCAACLSSVAANDAVALSQHADPAVSPTASSSFEDRYLWVGEVQPRSALEMAAEGTSNSFSIGAETIDRGYSTYDYWKAYLGPLGFSKARLQAGWARIETQPGIYDFSYIDPIVADMNRQGVKPWISLGYGNPIYSGGGLPIRQSPLPTNAEGSDARDRWLAFVRAMVTRYRGQVTEWEVWNEPDESPRAGVTADSYAEFALETAAVVRDVQPDAKILIGSFSGKVTPAFAARVIERFDAEKDSSLPDSDVVVTFHPYEANPDDVQRSQAYRDLRGLVEAAGFTLRQGENGAPSVNQPSAALRNFDWTEDGQAKWALRRLLSDFGSGIESNLFTIVELHYPPSDEGFPHSKNTKGLLQTGPYSPEPPLYGDQTVRRAKGAYRAVQNLAAIFDNRLSPVADPGCRVVDAGETVYSIQAYQRVDADGTARSLLAVWRSGDRPGEQVAGQDIDIVCDHFRLEGFARDPSQRPQYANLLTSAVYDLRQASTIVQEGTGTLVQGLRVFDHPVILADRGLVRTGQ